MFGPCWWWLSYRVIKAYFWGLVRGVWFSQQVSGSRFLRNTDLWTSSFPHFTVKFSCDLNMSGLAGLRSFSRGIFWLTGAGTPSSTIEAACTDYYFLTSKKTRSFIHFLPSLPSSLPPFPSLVQLSGQWDRGKEPSMYSQIFPPFPLHPLPSRRPPVQLWRSPQVPARSDVQHRRQHVHSSPLFCRACLLMLPARRYELGKGTIKGMISV